MSDAPRPQPGPGDDDFDPKQHVWDGNNWWTADHAQWWDGSAWQGRDVPQPPAPALVKKPRPPHYRRDFWLGFIGIILGNVALYSALQLLLIATNGAAIGFAALAPWGLNIGALILFAVIRPRVAIGMLVVYAIAFGLVLLAGIFLLVLCFGRMP